MSVSKVILMPLTVPYCIPGKPVESDSCNKQGRAATEGLRQGIGFPQKTVTVIQCVGLFGILASTVGFVGSIVAKDGKNAVGFGVAGVASYGIFQRSNYLDNLHRDSLGEALSQVSRTEEGVESELQSPPKFQRSMNAAHIAYKIAMLQGLEKGCFPIIKSLPFLKTNVEYIATTKDEL